MAKRKRTAGRTVGSPRSVVLVVLVNLSIAGASVAAGISQLGEDDLRAAAFIGFGVVFIALMLWLTSKMRN